MGSNRLAPNLAHALAVARDDARRRGDPEVTEAHVLAALGRKPVLALHSYLVREGLSVVRMLDALEEGEGTARLYRAASLEPPLSDDLDELLGAELTGWFGARPLDAEAFVETVFASPRGRELRKRARFPRATLEAFVARADAVRKSTRASTTLFVHAVDTFFDDASFVAATTIAGFDPPAARAALREYAPITLLPLPSVDDLARVAAKLANVLVRRDFDTAVMVATLLLAPDAFEMVEAMGIDPAAILWALVGGVGDRNDEEADPLFLSIHAAHRDY